MKKFLFSTLILTLIFFTSCANGNEKPTEKSTEKISAQEMAAVSTKIKITINGKIFDAMIDDSESARAFLEKLPLEVTMNELNGNEKYYRFNENFPSNDEHVGEISTGDLMLYDSSYIVLFYKDFSTSYSYTRLGKILNVADLASTLGGGNVTVKFER
ncbi:MAG: hypothetical protein IJS29_06415 [Selenomonadaceae bacterium]|nr:hypothetical protein [Selenomonadaceae bacterium]